jgi:hypothetical protein
MIHRDWRHSFIWALGMAVTHESGFGEDEGWCPLKRGRKDRSLPFSQLPLISRVNLVEEARQAPCEKLSRPTRAILTLQKKRYAPANPLE